jgi:ABC-2 type transport system permease protein
VLNNFALVQNMVDWAVADTDLLSIRSRGNHTRLLDVRSDSVGRWEWLNYGIVVLGLGIVVGVNALRRRTLVPIELDARSGAAGAPPDEPASDSDEPESKEAQP